MLLEEKTGYPTIDKPWLKYYSQEAIESAPFKGTVFQNIYLSNKLYVSGMSQFITMSMISTMR